MQKLSSINENIYVLISEINEDKDNNKRLYTLGILPNRKIKVIKNNRTKTPIIIEIDESRFIISKDIADNILVSLI